MIFRVVGVVYPEEMRRARGATDAEKYTKKKPSRSTI
jgi:hypothetical protein